MAEVWVAQRVSLGARKTVAVKVLAPNLAAKKKYRDMFIDEARISMALGNANIVQAFDAGQVNGEYYMAMEWVDGANVAELQAELWNVGRLLPIEVAVYITGEVLRALDYAHNVISDGAKTIVHRDVSPANVMVSVAGEVKLTDFGVARFGSEETSGLHVKGKLRYMPAEQLQGKSKEGTVDLYSVGAILHEMLDGFKFRGEDTEEGVLLGMIIKGVVPELGRPGRCSPELDAVRRGLLDPNLATRIPTAREALVRLRACPEYRVAAHELEALVRWYRGLDPRDRTHRPHRITETKASMSRARASDASMTNSGLGTAQPAQQAPGRWAAIGLLVAGGLFVATVTSVVAVLNRDGVGGKAGVSAAFGRREAQVRMSNVPVPVPAPVIEGQDPPSTEPPEAALPEPGGEQPETEGQVAVGADAAVGVEPTGDAGEMVIEDDDGVDAQQREVEPGPESSGGQPLESAPVAEPRPKAKPVDVEVWAGKLSYAYVKIGRREHLAEPSATFTLSPRAYTVMVRKHPNDEWVKFGRVKLQPNQNYKLELGSPKGLALTPKEP